MSAETLAGELRLPLFVIRLESLITRFMGETAAKLGLVFDETARHRGVYLFDEFDAVGGNRSATIDVAEMRRVLSSFLQFMEEPNSTDSVIIGATNYPELLDPVLLRCFDLVVEFSPPPDDEIRSIIKINLRPMRYPNLKWKIILASARGLSQSEITRATEDAVKNSILAERKQVTTGDILSRLSDKIAMQFNAKCISTIGSEIEEYGINLFSTSYPYRKQIRASQVQVNKQLFSEDSTSKRLEAARIISEKATRESTSDFQKI